VLKPKKKASEGENPRLGNLFFWSKIKDGLPRKGSERGSERLESTKEAARGDKGKTPGRSGE